VAPALGSPEPRKDVPDKNGAEFFVACVPVALLAMGWQIRANLGRHVRTGVDGWGWLWEIISGEQVAQVVIEISETAWSSDPLRLPEDTRHALETDGRTELLKVLDDETPPRVIRCGSSGCSYLSADEQG
jgi:hypothetical protein